MSFENPWGTYFQADEQIEYIQAALARNAYGSSCVYREKIKELQELKNIRYQCAMLAGLSMPENAEHERYG